MSRDTARSIQMLILLPLMGLLLVTLVLVYLTQQRLGQQFAKTSQAQQQDLVVIADAARFSGELGKVQQHMNAALAGAMDGSLDALQLYRMHSSIVNDLDALGGQMRQLAGSQLVLDANHGSARGLHQEFDAYRRFVIMTTDVLAVDPEVAGKFLRQAQQHYTEISIFVSLIGQRITVRSQERNQSQAHTFERLSQRMVSIGLGVLVLMCLVGLVLARRTSRHLGDIASALDQLAEQQKDVPALPRIEALQRSSHGMLQRLANAVLAFRAALQRQQAAEQEAFTLAFYDPLTQLPNRRLLCERMVQVLGECRRHPQWMALLVLDLDGFRHFNDEHGHSAGDWLLKEVALRLRGATGSDDTVARIGSNAFAILHKGLDSGIDSGIDNDLTAAASQASALAKKLVYTLAEPLQYHGQILDTTASVGVVLFNAELQDIEQPLKHAEAAMYQAKAEGRNRAHFYDPQIQARLEDSMRLQTDLRQAVPLGQLRLYYQIQVDAHDRVLGVEALVRWQHPERGMVSPAQFIPLAEASDLILPIGRWVLHTACLQLRAWADEGRYADLSISVNVSARQFRQPDFVQQVRDELDTTGAAPQRLELELTESLVLEEMETTIAKIAELRTLGVRFSLDDFGTGYSSLQYLKRLPIDQLKIDQSFVRDITIDANDAAIVHTIIAMGRALGLEVIAEGVETREQQEFLFGHGCHLYQGYFFARPLPLPELQQLLATSALAPRES